MSNPYESPLDVKPLPEPRAWVAAELLLLAYHVAGLAVILLMLLCGTVKAQGPRLEAQPKFAIERIAAPVDAATLAVADLNSFDSNSQPSIRYIWIPPWVSNGYAIAGQFLNEVVSRNANIVPPYWIDRDGVTLVRVDIRQYAPNPDDQQKLLAVWDKLETVYFPFKQASLDTFQGIDVIVGQTVNIQLSTFGQVAKHPGKVLERKGDTYRVHVTGGDVWSHKQYLTPIQPVATLNNLQLAHLGTEAQKLPGLTRSQVPIIRIDELIRQGYTSLDTDKFKGIYYDFVGIQDDTLNSLLLKLGANPAATNITRLPIVRSDVTARPRIVDIFYGTTVRPGSGTPLVTLTHDTLEEQRGVNWQDDLDNFLKIADKSEFIATRPNGTNLYAIFAGQKLLKAVPDNVAHNYKIPPPHNTQLAAGLGCVYCHADPDHTAGYIRSANDFRELLIKSPEFKSFIEGQQLLGVGTAAEVDNFKRLAAQVGTVTKNTPNVNAVLGNDFRQVEQIAAQFGTAWDTWPLQKAQQDYGRALRQATYGDVQVAAHSSVVLWNHYEHDPITSQIALRDIGFKVTARNGALGFQRIFGLPIGFEDPVFASLKVDKATDRGTWESKYPLAAERTAAALMLKGH